MRNPDGGHTLPILVIDIHQRVVKSPTAVFHALNQTLYPLVIVQQQVVDDNEMYGLLKVGFHRGIVLLPHIPEHDREPAALFNIEEHQIGNILRIRFQLTEVGYHLSAFGKRGVLRTTSLREELILMMSLHFSNSMPSLGDRRKSKYSLASFLASYSSNMISITCSLVWADRNALNSLFDILLELYGTYRSTMIKIRIHARRSREGAEGSASGAVNAARRCLLFLYRRL